MNSSTIKLLVSGILLLFLSACAPYQQAYYPAGGAYSGYGFTQRSYYGGYPYYNNNYHDDDDEHHHFDRHDGYNSHPSWNNGYVRPNPSNGYSHNYPDRKQQQFGYQSSVPACPGRIDHRDLHGNNNWNKSPSDHPWEHNNPHHGRPNSDVHVQNFGQNYRPDDQKNQIKEQRQYDHENNNRVRYENHEQAKNQRESRRWDHYQ
jgi:hypothetical protein